MQEQEFSPAESLLLIRNMIEKTKQGMYDNSGSFLLWGWGAFLACLSQFILKAIYNYPYHYRVWLITFVLVILNFFLIKKRKRAEAATSFIGEAMGNLWMGIGISFFVLTFIFSKMGWQYAYPIFIMMYGLGTFISGRFLQFKPLIIGGIVSWVLAAISVFFEYDYQILFACGALMVSYIIPGHILRTEYYKSKKTQELNKAIA